MRRPGRSFAFSLLMIASVALPSMAQQQYTPPGEFDDNSERMVDLMQQAIAKARWRVGRVYLDPWLVLKNIAYVDNVNNASTDADKASDLTATLGAGLRAYIPVASTWTVAAHALPEYVYWLEVDGRRRWNGRYGVGAFGIAGPATLEFSGTRRDHATFVSDELQEPANFGVLTGQASADIEIIGPLSLAFSASRQDSEYLDDEGTTSREVGRLDRQESVYRGGIRYQLDRGWRLGFGIEHSEADFDRQQSLLGNDGDSPYLELVLDGQDLGVRVDLVARQLDPQSGSAFPAFHEPTGSALFRYRAAGLVDLQFYARSGLVYSLEDDYAYYLSESFGVGLAFAPTDDLGIRLFAESGDNDYRAFQPTTSRRIDDRTAYGASLRVRLGRAFLDLGIRQTDYDSNQPNRDRSITSVTTGLRFSTSGSPWG